VMMKAPTITAAAMAPRRPSHHSDGACSLIAQMVLERGPEDGWQLQTLFTKAFCMARTLAE
jgi:hypothetical protein